MASAICILDEEEEAMNHRSPFTDVNIPDVSYPEFALARADELGARPAFVDAPSGRQITHGQLADSVRRVAAALAQRGLDKGDVFAIYLPNLPEYAVALYAVTSIGGVVTPISPMYTAAELQRQLRDARASYLLTLPQLLETVRDALPATGVREVFVLGSAPGATPLSALLAHEPKPPEVEIDPSRDLALLPYSSGTTGLPKGVMLTHRNLVANALQIANGPIDWREGEIAAAVPPMFHAYGVAMYFGALMRYGSTIVSMPRFDFEQFLQVIERYKATFAPVVPPVALALAQHPVVDKYDLKSLRTVASGAAPLAEAVALAVERRLGAPMQQGFGMTELSGATHIQAQEDPKASVGRALPLVEWRIADPATGATLPLHEHGEILIRGPNVMQGYLNRPDETRTVLEPDGWLHTGDLGYADAAGRCFIVDRLKELIKYKGYQVAPVELEGLLLSHPQVADACVVPRADAEAGEVPKAFVVARGSVSAEALIDFVASSVAPYKRIRTVEFIDTLPRSPAGKLLRRVLVERDRAAARA
jgi:acyl-CoA synthetase (AMP-forming)/AMP-acid ligase II